MAKAEAAEVHPGEILHEQMEEFELSANALAGELGVPANRISGILRGDRGITADTALRLARFFDQTPEFWMRSQAAYDLAVAERYLGAGLKRIRRIVRSEVESVAPKARVERTRAR
jgi:antitoxin HigA-1